MLRNIPIKRESWKYIFDIAILLNAFFKGHKESTFIRGNFMIKSECRIPKRVDVARR